MNHTRTKRAYAQWTADERQKIFRYIALCVGKPNWQKVADCVGTKTKRQCYDFYQQNKDAQSGGTTRHKWSAEEEQVIIDCVLKNGFSVDQIKLRLPHLSQHQIKNRYYNLIQRGRLQEPKQQGEDAWLVTELVNAMRQFYINEVAQ